MEFLSPGVYVTYFYLYIPITLFQLSELSEWELPKQFVVDKQQRVMYADGYNTSRALSSSALNSAKIKQKFDEITYYKGKQK